jgi:hypothetical protein
MVEAPRPDRTSSSEKSYRVDKVHGEYFRCWAGQDCYAHGAVEPFSPCQRKSHLECGWRCSNPAPEESTATLNFGQRSCVQTRKHSSGVTLERALPSVATNLLLLLQRVQESNQRSSILSAQLVKASRRIVCFAIVTRDSIFQR